MGKKCAPMFVYFSISSTSHSLQTRCSALCRHSGSNYHRHVGWEGPTLADTHSQLSHFDRECDECVSSCVMPFPTTKQFLPLCSVSQRTFYNNYSSCHTNYFSVFYWTFYAIFQLGWHLSCLIVHSVIEKDLSFLSVRSDPFPALSLKYTRGQQISVAQVCPPLSSVNKLRLKQIYVAPSFFILHNLKCLATREGKTNADRSVSYYAGCV